MNEERKQVDSVIGFILYAAYVAMITMQQAEALKDAHFQSLNQLKISSQSIRVLTLSLVWLHNALLA